MRRAGTPWGTAEDLQVQKACVALADERQILNDHLSELFFQKFDNPLAGIVGAHLLLLSIRGKTQGETAVQLNQLNEVVKNLRELVGAEHPDVEAISLACSDQTLRKTASALSVCEREVSDLRRRVQGVADACAAICETGPGSAAEPSASARNLLPCAALAFS